MTLFQQSNLSRDVRNICGNTAKGDKYSPGGVCMLVPIAPDGQSLLLVFRMFQNHTMIINFRSLRQKKPEVAMICLLFWLRFEPSVSKHGGKTKTLNAGGRTRSEAVGPPRFYVLFNKYLKTLWTHRLLVHNLGDHALKDVVEVKTEDEPIVQYFWMAALD